MPWREGSGTGGVRVGGGQGLAGFAPQSQQPMQENMGLWLSLEHLPGIWRALCFLHVSCCNLESPAALQSPLHRSRAFTSQTSPKLAPAVLDMPNPESLRKEKKKKRGKNKPKSSQGHQALFSRRMSCLNPGVLPPLLPKSARARGEWDQM